MTDRKRIVVRLKDDMKRHVESKDNVSAYIRRLIEEDMKGHDTRMVGVQLQIETLEQQAQAAAERHEMFQSRVEELRELQEQAQQQRSHVVEQAQETLSVPADPSNPAIQNWANKAGMSPEEFADEYAQQ